jgi:hypothetical protein
LKQWPDCFDAQGTLAFGAAVDDRLLATATGQVDSGAAGSHGAKIKLIEYQ